MTRPSRTAAGPGQRAWSGRASRMQRRERALAVTFIVPAVVLVGVLIYVPMARVVFSTLTEEVAGVRQFIGLDAYRDVIGTQQLRTVVTNSVFWVVGVVALQNVLGMAAAVLLNERLPLRGLTRSVLLIPWVLPGVAAALLWRFMYDAELGVINGLLRSSGVITENVAWLGDTSTAMAAVVLAAVWKGFPFSMVMYLAGLQSVDRNHLEAAMVDGAGPWRRFRHITLPSIGGIVRLNLLLTTIFTFNYFDMIWVATRGGPRQATHIFPTYIYQLGFGQFQFDQAAVYGVFAAIVLGLISYFYLRRLRLEEAA